MRIYAHDLSPYGIESVSDCCSILVVMIYEFPMDGQGPRTNVTNPGEITQSHRATNINYIIQSHEASRIDGVKPVLGPIVLGSMCYYLKIFWWRRGEVIILRTYMYSVLLFRMYSELCTPEYKYGWFIRTK